MTKTTALGIVVTVLFCVAMFPICMLKAYRAFNKVIVSKDVTSTRQLLTGLAWMLMAIIMVGFIIWGFSDG